MMMTGSHRICISQSIYCKFMFLPPIIYIIPFTQTTKIWIHKVKEVMAITASHIRTETRLDCFIDWQVYSWVTPLYAVMWSSKNQIEVQTEKS